jgi:hypothetical protein
MSWRAALRNAEGIRPDEFWFDRNLFTMNVKVTHLGTFEETKFKAGPIRKRGVMCYQNIDRSVRTRDDWELEVTISWQERWTLETIQKWVKDKGLHGAGGDIPNPIADTITLGKLIAGGGARRFSVAYALSHQPFPRDPLWFRIMGKGSKTTKTKFSTYTAWTPITPPLRRSWFCGTPAASAAGFQGHPLLQMEIPEDVKNPYGRMPGEEWTEEKPK